MYIDMRPRRVEDMELELSLVERPAIFDQLISQWPDPKTVALLMKRTSYEDVGIALSNQDLEIASAGAEATINAIRDRMLSGPQAVGPISPEALHAIQAIAEYEFPRHIKAEVEDTIQSPEVEDTGSHMVVDYSQLEPDTLDHEWKGLTSSFTRPIDSTKYTP